jgi:hypothetical protein
MFLSGTGRHPEGRRKQTRNQKAKFVGRKNKFEAFYPPPGTL